MFGTGDDGRRSSGHLLYNLKDQESLCVSTCVRPSPIWRAVRPIDLRRGGCVAEHPRGGGAECEVVWFALKENM